MKAGDEVTVLRYAKCGRPHKGSVTAMVPGVVRKLNGSIVLVEFAGGEVIWVRADKVTPVVKQEAAWTTSG